MADGSLNANEWWLDDPLERYWVETLSERRPTLGRQLHAPQLDGSGGANWRYAFVAETRPGDVVLHWLRSRSEHGFVGWSVVNGLVETRPIRWHARGTYGRRRPDDNADQAGWWVPLRDYHELSEPIELADLNAQRAEIERTHTELRGRFGDPLYLALTLYRTRGVQVGQGYLFKWPAALNEVFSALHGMGQLTAGEPSEPTSDRPKRTGRRSRRRREQRFIKAVELHAMAAATSWYEGQGYEVEDVSARKSWDLEATRGDEVRRVEVKGSAGLRDAVDLTANEVRNATAWSPCDLLVVDRIELVEVNGMIQTSGGRVRRWADWTPAPDSLEPVTYSHLLHADPELHHVPTSIDFVDP